ncbi:MAG: hypothetical protein L6R39_003744, partial [Caloplaca ligustica]
MPVMTKIRGAVTLIKAIKQKGEDEPEKPLIRHQNPRMNPPGIAPSPPLSPPPTVLAPVSNDAESRMLPGEANALIERSRVGLRSIKKSPERGRFLIERHLRPAPAVEVVKPDHRVPVPEVKAGENEKFEPTNRPQTTLIPQPLTVHRSTGNLRSTGSRPCSSRSSPNHPLPRIPHQRMHFLARLGTGGEGRCDLFRLYNPPQTLLAVKTLKGGAELVRHRDTKRKPLEAYILQDLLPPHKRIIQMHDYTWNPMTTKLYLEYCPLGDLQEIIDNFFKRDIRIPEGFIWHVLQQLAEAVHHLHTAAKDENGKHITILHRDIKPANVLLRPSSIAMSASNPQGNQYPDLVLADFGCSTHLPATPHPTFAVGTLRFQGPEAPLQCAASDIWSLGCTVHALVHGYAAMCRRPEGWSTEQWEWDPESRVVESPGLRGYSASLSRAVAG